MQSTYIASSNTATNGTALGAGDNDVTVFRVLVGLPTDTSTLTIYNISNPVNAATTNIAYKLTQPTAAAGKEWQRNIDFGAKGLQLSSGGNVVIDGTNNVTILWELTDEVQ
jgi:hypothetical protein